MPITAHARAWALRGAAVGTVISLVLAFASWARAAQEEIEPGPTGYHTKSQDPNRRLADIYTQVGCDERAPDQACLDLFQLIGSNPVWPREDNYVYVAAFADDDDSWGVVGTSGMFAIPFGSTITAIRYDFQVEDSPEVGTFELNREDPGLVICLATTGFAGGDNGSWDTRPETDCSVQAVPAPAGVDGDLVTFTADLMPLATAWADGRDNLGFVIRPSRDAPDNFQLAIRPATATPPGMRLHVTYEEGQEEVFDQGSVGGAFGFSDTFMETEFSEGTPGEPGVPPTFSVPEEAAPEAAGPARRRPSPVGDPQNKWWMFIGIPLGLALLGAMAQGVAQPLEARAQQRIGPVSRLMQRKTIIE